MSSPRVALLLRDIAAQFAHLPLPVAAESVARHVTTFWAPRMRAALLAMPEGVVDELDERAKAAVAILRQEG